MTSSYCKHICSFCGKIVSSSGFPKVSHYRKHVREGIAFEVGPSHPEYSGCYDFINLQRRANVNTVLCNILLHEYSYRPKVGMKIKFRYTNPGEWLHGIVGGIIDDCVFITLT